MRMKTLAKKDINKTLGIWAQKYEVLSPMKTENGDCIFGAFSEKTFTLDYKKPPLSPKSVLFPQAEIIFNVENNNYQQVVGSKKTLIFGMRACDMMGIRQASSFMGRDNKDIYYQAKQNAAATIVMACPGPQNETCFCTTTRSGPVAGTGFDLQFYDTGNAFLIEIGSPRGSELLSGMSLSEINDSAAKKQIDEFTKKAVKAIPEVKSVINAMNKLKDKKVEDKVWEDFGAKCITCGGCAFVCPTCTCFNVYDQQFSSGNGIRLRSWDACLYGGFTREASGHNPRLNQALRLKRRHEHKLFDYNKIDIQDGLCGCVGCGRCSDYCPVHIGTLEVVKAIAE
jgi:formate hydrogenlyase subunit 6/NADH:ubiquinone oxidoreductase subunit I